MMLPSTGVCEAMLGPFPKKFLPVDTPWFVDEMPSSVRTAFMSMGRLLMGSKFVGQS
jgi:hypothetical protein